MCVRITYLSPILLLQKAPESRRFSRRRETIELIKPTTTVSPGAFSFSLPDSGRSWICLRFVCKMLNLFVCARVCEFVKGLCFKCSPRMPLEGPYQHISILTNASGRSINFDHRHCSLARLPYSDLGPGVQASNCEA